VSFSNQLALLSKGSVPGIFSAEHLRAIILEGQRKLPGFIFPIPFDVLSQDLSLTYRLMNSKPESGHAFVITIPFIHPAKGFTLNRIIPFPMKDANEVLVIHTNLPRYLAYDAEVFFSLDSLSDCVDLGDKLICDKSRTERSVSFADCTYETVLDIPKRQESCVYDELRLVGNVYAVSSHARWYLYFGTPTLVSVDCPDVQRTVKCLVGHEVSCVHGPLIVSPPYFLHTQFATYQTINMVQSTIPNEPVYIFPLTPVNFSVPLRAHPIHALSD
jgi:hypothetical protein